MIRKLTALFILALSFNVFSFGSFSTFEEFSREVRQKVRNGEMKPEKAKRCIVTSWKEYIKNDVSENLLLKAVCFQNSDEKKINWDYPEFEKGGPVQIYVYGSDKIREIKNGLARRNVTFSLFENLAYYSPGSSKYEKNVYYYYKQ